MKKTKNTKALREKLARIKLYGGEHFMEPNTKVRSHKGKSSLI
jgi:hypothetical protein